MAHPQVTIRNSQLLTISSTFVEQTYNLYVAFPDSYGESDSAYPVIYFTDADISFGMATDILRNNPFRKNFVPDISFPELIVVGIGYPGGAAEMDQKRCRDLSPLPKPDPDSGEADRFMMFVTDEAIPLIESTFRVIPTDRTLVGCSMGGLFTLYALFQHPSVFQRYLLSSPRIEPIVFDWEDRHSQTCNQLPAHLYMSAGTEGKIEPILHERVMKLSERLTGRSYKGLKLWTEEFTGEDHVSVQPMALARGLNLIFTETSR